MSTSRWLSRERRNRYRGKRGPNGRHLCRWCGTEVTDKRRRTWCGDACVHEYLLRTSGSYLRAQVKKRDKGVCARCSCDCYQLRRVVREYVEQMTGDDGRNWMSGWSPRQVAIGAALLAELGFGRVTDIERSYWEAEHVVPVVEGGGEAGLEGIITLCRACHLESTRQLAARRAKARKERPKEP